VVTGVVLEDRLGGRNHEIYSAANESMRLLLLPEMTSTSKPASMVFNSYCVTAEGVQGYRCHPRGLRYQVCSVLKL